MIRNFAAESPSPIGSISQNKQIKLRKAIYILFLPKMSLVLIGLSLI